MIMRHQKDHLSVRLVKLNSSVQISHRQSSGASLWGRNSVSKLLAAIGEIGARADEICSLVKEVVDLAMQIYLEVDRVDVQELLDSHNQELIKDELIETQEQDIEELESLAPVQSEDRMTVENLTEGLGLIEKGLHKF
ncbi:hypothetical protein TNCV_3821861 [Trichonephila clavipes]|nr:hypothetical protein TNCV_3821861 [Trichonephila clavipes]